MICNIENRALRRLALVTLAPPILAVAWALGALAQVLEDVRYDLRVWKRAWDK